MSACPICGKPFADEHAVQQHARMKHKRDLPRQPLRAREESMAEIAIEAMIKRASGQPLDDLEESLLP